MLSPNLTIHPGDQLDHFQLESIVATSGMATVFRAKDLETGQQVAIKVPHPEMESDPVMFDRFKREQDIGTQMDHPGVMKVLPNPDRSQVYMVMEWVPGRLLRQIMNEEKKLPAARAVHLTLGICEALEYIHNRGVAHRDLKPENVMVDENDNIRLIDFGIAANAGSRRLTFANFSQSMGTPDYISPEQVRGKRGDARSDIYALGVMLYEMLTGVPPYTRGDHMSVMYQHVQGRARPPSEINTALPQGLSDAVMKAMSVDKNKRFQSMDELRGALEAYL